MKLGHHVAECLVQLTFAGEVAGGLVQLVRVLVHVERVEALAVLDHLVLHAVTLAALKNYYHSIKV